MKMPSISKRLFVERLKLEIKTQVTLNYSKNGNKNI